MRYVYNGAYTEFRGYVFAHGKIVEVKDRGTIEALNRRINEYHDFRRIVDRPTQDEPVAVAHQVAANDRDACPKCGRIVRQGRYMHIKHCRGAQ